jgi:plastocyanin
MLKRTITICLTVAALGAGVAACGGSSSDAPEAAAKAPASTPAAASATTAVSVQDNTFKPADLKVAIGDTVTFTNEGAVAHTVTATDGADFDSGTLAPGKTFSFTAKKAGTVSYVCTIHPGMQGTIQVG